MAGENESSGNGNNLGATIVVVTHELASIFVIGNNCVFLDA
jgi:phospholipid/cholesterol/gamma-HCH transport system ATP-binding protein